MEKTLSLNDFTILLIATLANNSKEKNAFLPIDYKQRIENILCAENGWKEKFSILIDTKEYFDDHFAWEQQLASEIKNFLHQMRKSYKYDFTREIIEISFSENEINELLSKYKDENIKKVMSHFVTLISDYIYTREFQEQVHDYSSNSVQYMKKLIKIGDNDAKYFSSNKNN